jgi:carbon storage regulator CsrA
MALVLTRKTGQRLFIGTDISVRVGRVFPDGKVRLCIEAPPEVKVVREELLIAKPGAQK